MKALDALATRASALKLTEPAPEGAALEAILEAALRAPDHGRLRPWRFLLIRGDARARLGALMAEAHARAHADASAEVLAAQKAKALRAPLIIVVAAAVDPAHPKIPEVEQIVSAGCAAEHIMLAAHALGFGAMWKTGRPAYDPGVKAALGLAPHDHIVGFLYLGAVALADPGKAARPTPGEHVFDWTGPVPRDAPA